MSQGWQYVITWVKKRFLQLTPFNPLYSQIFRENFAKNFPEPDCTEHTLDIVNLRNRDDPEHNWTFALFSVTLLVWRKRLAKDNPRCIYLSWNFWHRKKKHTQNAIFVFLFNPKNYTTTVFFRNKYSTVVFMHHSQKIAQKTRKFPSFSRSLSESSRSLQTPPKNFLSILLGSTYIYTNKLLLLSFSDRCAPTVELQTALGTWLGSNSHRVFIYPEWAPQTMHRKMCACSWWRIARALWRGRKERRVVCSLVVTLVKLLKVETESWWKSSRRWRIRKGVLMIWWRRVVKFELPGGSTML